MNIILGLFIGALVSLPIGPLGIICTQQTISRGWKNGFFAGIGSAIADMLFASAAIFGISFIDDLIHQHIYLINGVTGGIFLLVGLKIYLQPLPKHIDEESDKKIMHPTLSTFLFGISNPVTFLIFLTIFAKVQMVIDTSGISPILILIGSIFSGAIIFWFLASNLIEHSKKIYKMKTFYYINRILGLLLILFGSYSILKGIFKF